MSGVTATQKIAAPADPVAGLEQVLSQLIDAHEEMLTITAHHREAISRADGHGVQSCVEQTGVLAARIADLEVERRTIVTTLTRTGERNRPTLTALAAGLPEPSRARVLSLAARLRGLLIQLRQELGVIRSATQALVGHMDGLMQQVVRAVSQTRLYDTRGRMDPGPTGVVAAGGLDLTH